MFCRPAPSKISRYGSLISERNILRPQASGVRNRLLNKIPATLESLSTLVAVVATVVFVQYPRLAKRTTPVPVLKPRHNALGVKGVATEREQPDLFALLELVDADRTGRAGRRGEMSKPSLGPKRQVLWLLLFLLLVGSCAFLLRRSCICCWLWLL